MIASGNEALSRGEWGRARVCFSDALLLEESPEALEGLGTAAWWLDDGATVFRAREQAYRAYRRLGDRRGAGRVAMALAEDHLQFRGEAVVARGWHRRAHRLLDGLEPAPEHGWLLFWEGDLALTLREDPVRVRTFALNAGAVGRALDDVDLEMAALALEGVAQVVAGDASAGMQRLDEATAAAISGEMTSPLAIGLSCCYLVTACERTRDFVRAAEWCGRVKAFCEETGFQFLLGICRAQHATVQTWRGSWAEAEEELQAVTRQFGTSRPGLDEEVRLRLAELRRVQGRLDEAATLLTRVHAEHPDSILGRAALALEREDPASALQLTRRVLRHVPRSSQAHRVGALDLLVRAALAVGDRVEALAALDELRAIAAALATDAMKASALVGEGLVAMADADYARARDAFEDGVDRLAASGASFDLASCRVELARALAALGRRDAADAELRAALHAFAALGAERRVAKTAALRRDLASRAPHAGGLSRRETEVLRLVCDGLSNHEIATRLDVSEFTIKRHVGNVLAKLRLPSRAAAAAYAVRAGLW